MYVTFLLDSEHKLTSALWVYIYNRDRLTLRPSLHVQQWVNCHIVVPPLDIDEPSSTMDSPGGLRQFITTNAIKTRHASRRLAKYLSFSTVICLSTSHVCLPRHQSNWQWLTIVFPTLDFAVAFLLIPMSLVAQVKQSIHACVCLTFELNDSGVSSSQKLRAI